MLYSLQPSTTSGNSGAEQFNIKVSAPVKSFEGDGAEIPSATCKDVDIIEEKPKIIETVIEEKIEEAPLEEKVETTYIIEENSGAFEEDFEEETIVKTASENSEETIEEIEETSIIQEETIIKETNEISNNVTNEIVTEAVVEIVKNEPIIKQKPEIDISEVVGGFEDARRILKDIYKKVLNETFKPTLNDATVDLLAYIGAKAESYDKKQEFIKAFGVDTSRFADRYRDKNYLPIAFKISVWVDKNKGLSYTVDLLNGILQTLFALNVGNSESEIVEIVKDSLLGLIDYLESEGINSGF